MSSEVGKERCGSGQMRICLYCRMQCSREQQSSWAEDRGIRFHQWIDFMAPEIAD